MTELNSEERIKLKQKLKREAKKLGVNLSGAANEIGRAHV